jgi:multiple sugar transport system ATP-binding protein
LDGATIKALKESGARRMTVGFRPEHLVPSYAAEDSAGGHLHGRVELVEQLGSTTNIQFSAGDQAFTAELARDHALRVGDSIELSLLPGLVHIFDAESGQRLNAPAASGTDIGMSAAPQKRVQQVQVSEMD